jgi:short-subunit dehydrogenase
MEKKVALVTGASAGIGMDAALQLAAAGFIVYAAARRVDRMASLKEHGVKVLSLDITDEQSIADCLAAIRAQSGGIDVLVNNAGYGAYGALEEVPMSEARRQFDVNLFGLARLTQQVLPHMRQRRWGRIINVSSIGGVGAAPYGGWYHATKFALEGYSAALRQELAPFGVDVSVIRPGGTVSEWADIAAASLEATSARGPYAAAVQAMIGMFKAGLGSKLIEPASVIGKLILKAAIAARPKSVYVAPRMARIAIFLRWILSDRWHDAMVRSAMKLPKTMG